MMRKFALAIVALFGLSSAAYAAFAIFQTAIVVPSSANIPIASLPSTTYAANFWTGFTTAGTTVSNVGGFQRLVTTVNATTTVTALGNSVWRDAEVTYFFTQGRAVLRGSCGGNALVMDIGIGGPTNTLVIGRQASWNCSNPAPGATTNATYIQTNASGCITNWPTTADHTFTFGVRGFDIYLLIDGVQAIDTCQKTELNPTGAIRYQDYRTEVMQAGQVAVYGSLFNQVTATYFPLTLLYSNYASGSFDPRDFGMRTLPATTGSMSAGSCTLTLSGARDIRVNDKIIVEIGGESGAGARNTIGVGGSSPELHYANAAARDADTTQPNTTYAYIDTDGSTAAYSTATSTWSSTPGIGQYSPGAVYYAAVKAPVSLIASVTAVNASPATVLTLSTWGANYKPNCSSVATTNANVYLDSLPSFYPMTSNPAWFFNAARNDGLNTYQNMTITTPAGTWYMSEAAVAYRQSNGDRSGLVFQGAGQVTTTFKSPKGVSSGLFATNTANLNVTVQDFSYAGNRADNGYMWTNLTTTDAAGNVNKNWAGDAPVAISGGAGANNLIVQRIDCLNDFRGCAATAGSDIQILNSQAVNTEPQRAYLQWEFHITTAFGTLNKLENLTATSPYLHKAFNCWGTNPCIMNNLSGTNSLFAVVGSSNTTITNISTNILPDSFIDVTSGSLNEGVVQINNNNNHGGSGGSLSNFRIVVNGYTQLSTKRQVGPGVLLSATQSNWTVSGNYSGVSSCTSVPSGYMEWTSPWDGTSGNSFGAAGVVASNPVTNIVVDGIRVVGSAAPSPGFTGGYWSNISALPSNPSALTVTNSVYDVAQTGGGVVVGSGNRTNATFCP